MTRTQLLLKRLRQQRREITYQRHRANELAASLAQTAERSRDYRLRLARIRLESDV